VRAAAATFEDAGPPSAMKDGGDLRRYLARSERDVMPAVAERQLITRRRGVVASHVAHYLVAAVVCRTVQFDEEAELLVPDVAVLVVPVARGPHLTLSRWQVVRALDVPQVSPFEH
jgi:hypothetical protein